MKRTLTAAAAVLAGGAGAVGFAGSATAAPTPDIPNDLPIDSNLGKTVFHTAATVASAKQTVGDVVPLDPQGARSGKPAADPIQGLLDNTNGGQDGLLGDVQHVLPVGQVLPAGQTLPAGRSSNVGQGILPAPIGSAIDKLPAAHLNPARPTAGLAPKSGGPLDQVTGEDGPLGAVTGEDSPLAGLADQAPTGKSGAANPIDAIGKIVSHGPLGGTHKLGG
ncbi:hypothetical protein [Saccharopolyspora rosea]|uniref:ATP-binding protein n=1 Tax=Saccharopolyspora rosea TaxID=524884 RepID=A0ABW3FQN0_9PSEU|nr:hypothetical protein [Saccharopolyspora rosea]